MNTLNLSQSILRGCLAVTITALTFVNVNAQSEEYPYDFEYGGIHYAYHNNGECMAVKSGMNFYRGDIFVPSTAYDGSGKAYKVTRIDDAAFAYCSNLTSVVLSEGIETLGAHAFESDEALASVSLPSTLTLIDSQCFSMCKNLSSIDIPGSVTTIGDEAFVLCGLTSVTFHEGLQYIGYQAFAVTNIESLSLPNTLRFLKTDAFAYCDELTGVINLPASLMVVGGGIFSRCSNINAIQVDPGCLFVKFIDNVLVSSGGTLLYYPDNNKYMRDEYYTPNYIYRIEEDAFNNISLNVLSLSENVAAIFPKAFQFCEFNTVVFPSTLSSIGDEVFSNTTVHNLILEREEPIQFDEDEWNDPFRNTSLQNHTTLIVPKGCVEKYRNAPVWRKFLTITDEMPADCPPLHKCQKPNYAFVNGGLSCWSDTEGTRCDVNFEYYYSGGGMNGTRSYFPTTEITIIAKKDGYADSDPVEIRVPMTFGKYGDLNVDGSTDVGDEILLRKEILNDK